MTNIDHNQYKNMIFGYVSYLFTEAISTEEQTNFVPCWTSEFQTHIFSLSMTPLSSVIITGPCIGLYFLILIGISLLIDSLINQY